MFELKKYHGDKVQSLTYDDNQTSFSVGIIAPGEYEFGAMRKEIYTVTSGAISCVVEGDKVGQKTYQKNESFIVPYRKNFRLGVTQISTYICYYE